MTTRDVARNIERGARRHQPRHAAPPSAFDILGRLWLSGANLHRVRGIGDINDDAEAVFSRAGINADCAFVPYQGPFGGGTNICDVAGDERGREFGAELIARPGGIDIYRTEAANASRLVAEREAEQRAIQALVRQQPQAPAPVAPPVINYHPPVAAPPDLPYHPPTVTPQAPRIPPPAPATPAPPAPAPRTYEAAPPPGWWTYGSGQQYRVNPLAQPQIRQQPAQTSQPLYTLTTTSTPATTTATGGSGSSNGSSSGGGTTRTDTGPGVATPMEPLIAEPAAGGTPAIDWLPDSFNLDTVADVPKWVWMAGAAAAAVAVYAANKR